jgi:hypothetical protein
MGAMKGHSMVKHFYICFNDKILENLLFKKPLTPKISNLLAR